MSSYVKGKGLGQEEARVHRIRITLTSKNVKNLEKGTILLLPPYEYSYMPRARHILRVLKGYS